MMSVLLRNATVCQKGQIGSNTLKNLQHVFPVLFPIRNHRFNNIFEKEET